MKTGCVLVTYAHNNADKLPENMWYVGKYASKHFNKVPEAKQWIKDNPQYTPCKLLVMNTRNEIYRTLIDYGTYRREENDVFPVYF